MNKIIFTGTASGYPSKERACSSFILQTGRKLFQFDAGEGISGSVQKFKIKYNEIDKIFISHLHPDHIAGIFMELQLMYLDNIKKPPACRRARLDIYMPSEALKMMVKSTDMFYLFEEKFPFRFKFLPIRLNPVFRGKEFTLFAYHNEHFRNNEKVINKFRKPNKMQSYSYIININGKRIFYSGDVQSENDIAALLDDIHTAIIEGLHVDFKSLAEICAFNKVKRLVLTHLDEKSFSKPDRLFKIAQKAGLKKLVIAYDGLRLGL